MIDVLETMMALIKLVTVGNEARRNLHASDHTPRCLLATFTSWAGTFIDFQVVDSNPDTLFGESGCILKEIGMEYNYDLMHRKLKYTHLDLILGFPGPILAPLVYW